VSLCHWYFQICVWRSLCVVHRWSEDRCFLCIVHAPRISSSIPDGIIGIFQWHNPSGRTNPHPVPLSWNLGTLTSWNLLGHSRPVTRLLYLYIYVHFKLPEDGSSHKPKHAASNKGKVKSFPYRPGVAQRVPGGLGSQIFMTFGTWRWWGRQSHAPTAFTSRNVPGTHFH
jgi:hypothetical protein